MERLWGIAGILGILYKRSWFFPMRIRKWIVILIVLALLITMFLPFLSAGAQGKEGHTIRVALFLDTASYHNTKETVTLTGGNGFTLKDSSGLTISSHNPGEEVRFSPYLYRILVKETGNAGEAQNLVQRVEQAGFSAELMMVTRRGKPLYRVETGQASSLSAAQSLLANLQGKTGLSGEILGMYAWEAGLFAKEAEALARVKAIQDAGFDAHLALLPKNGSDPSYMVLAGNEGTEAELASYSQEFTASLPGISLTPLTHKNYVIKETDSLTGEGEGTGIAHYYYPIGMKIIAEPITGKSPAALTVEEKGNTYRGRMEFSVSNGRLALVNELPLEEYLYGVVGAEMSTGWPMEALKAQAVIARTFAVGRGNKWGIANVVDSTLDQAYYGIKREGTDIIQAVNETSGLVLTYEGKMIEALYSSNTGGMTADGSEVWGNPVPYLRPVSSPDTLPLQKAATWYRIARENGQIGYVHSDYITSTEEKNRIDLPYGVVNTDSLNFRSGPGTSHDVIGKLTSGEYVTILETVKEDNPYAWIGGPADGIELMNAFNS
ncbi:MAG: SpoIID/LytB domain-containing protein, partial [Thermicanus sp.]|nr:SpoIID/LytB domain-containing protein [Thermicanus sp.]